MSCLLEVDIEFRYQLPREIHVDDSKEAVRSPSLYTTSFMRVSESCITASGVVSSRGGIGTRRSRKVDEEESTREINNDTVQAFLK